MSHPKRSSAVRSASFQRRLRVAAEVVVVLQEDRVQQQLQLDLEVDSLVRARRYFGIQTRISDSSLSTSSGLAM